MLSLVWQIIRQDLLKYVNLEAHPEMITLMENGEDLAHFQALTPENTLLRWFNQQLTQAGHPRRVNNFSGDIADGENYLALLHQIAPTIVPTECLQEQNPQIRAQMVCDFASKMGVDNFVTPKDILEGNRNLNLAFVADLFNKYPSIVVQQYDQLQSQALQQADLESKLKLEEEEKARQARWAEEEARRAALWAAEDQQRRAHLENEERLRREREAQHTQHLQGEEARLAFEQQRLAEERKKLEEARARDEHARSEHHMAEQRRIEDEHRRIEEEKRRLDEEMRRRDEDRRRQEEGARRELEDQRRRLEDEKRAWEQTKTNTNLILPSPPPTGADTNQQTLFVADPYSTHVPVPISDPYSNQPPVPYSAANYNPYTTPTATYSPAATYDPYVTGVPAYGSGGSGGVYGGPGGVYPGGYTTTTYGPGGGSGQNSSHVEINISGKMKKKAMKNLTKNLPAITAQAQHPGGPPGYMGPGGPPGYPAPAAGYGGGGYPSPGATYGAPGYGTPGYGQPPAY